VEFGEKCRYGGPGHAFWPLVFGRAVSTYEACHSLHDIHLAAAFGVFVFSFLLSQALWLGPAIRPLISCIIGSEDKFKCVLALD
jgi:hypothetical protein